MTFSALVQAIKGKEIVIKFSLPSGDFTEKPSESQALAYLERLGKRHGVSFDYDPPEIVDDTAYLGPRAGIVFVDKREGYDIYFR